jgi:hypothetical protein
MAVSNNAPVNTQTLKDALFISNAPLLPSGAANTSTNWLDLGNPVAANGANVGLYDVNANASTPYPVTRYLLANLITTASASGNSINMNIIIQQAPAYANGVVDTGNITNIPVCVANGSAIGADTIIKLVPSASVTNASNTQFALPPGTKRFVRATAVGVTNMGNLADGTMTLELLF